MPKCRISECVTKRAMFNFPTKTKGTCCSKIINFDNNITKEICKYEECKNISLYKRKIIYCDFMGCKIIPTFNYENEKMDYIAVHINHIFY